MSNSTTPGSANVLMSPKLSVSPATIFLNIRRIIFPERVMGKLGLIILMWNRSDKSMSDYSTQAPNIDCEIPNTIT
jgi:hypothetical protein